MIFYAFALPNANYGLDFNYGSNYMLKRLVAAAKPRGTKVVLSIGGWGGSRYFSPAVSTPANRAVFIQNIKNVIADSGIDGVDFDWSTPTAKVPVTTSSASGTRPTSRPSSRRCALLPPRQFSRPLSLTFPGRPRTVLPSLASRVLPVPSTT